MIRKSADEAMSPDMLTIPVMPESRLKALVLANALLHAILSALCIAFRNAVTHHAGLPSPLIALGLGFSLAFHALFLFRVSVKEPVSRRMVNAAAAVDVAGALGLTVILVVPVFTMTATGIKAFAVVAGLQFIVGIALLVVSNFSSSHGFSPAEIISV